jgi:hypothetical protein
MPCGNDILYAGLSVLDGKTDDIYRECENLFSKAEKQGRILISPFIGGIKYSVLEEHEIPSVFMRFFQRIEKNPASFGSARIKDFVRHREPGKSYYMIEPYFVFVPASVPAEDRDHKTVHEYVELCTQDWRRAVSAGFRSVSAKNDSDFLRRYTERWIDGNEEWLRNAAPERREFMIYLPEASRKILVERGCL